MNVTRSKRALEAELRLTLTAKADQLTFGAPYLGASRAEVPVETALEACPSRAGHARRAIAIATIAVLIAVAGIAVVARGDSSGRKRAATKVTLPAALEAPVPDRLLLPAAAPAGMQLWSLVTQATTSGNPNAVTQLMGAVDGTGSPSPGLLIEMQSTSPGSSVDPGASEHVLVRGRQAAVVGSKDGGDASTEVSWIEDDVWVRVTLRGITPSAAADVLNGLRPRDGVLLHGFDPNGLPAGMTLLGEHIAAPGAASDAESYAEYGTVAPTAGAPGGIFVHTNTAYGYPGYLRTWMAGTGDAHGSEQLDPDIGLIVDRADGSQIMVGPPSAGRALLEQVAASVTMREGAAVVTTIDALNSRLGRLPVIATTRLGSVTYDLRGAGNPTTLCARVAAGPAVCSPPVGQFQTTQFEAPQYALGSALLDGQWLVFGAAPAQPGFSLGGVAASRSAVQPGQATGTIGPWRITSVVVPDGVDQVSGTTDGSSFLTIVRPG